MRIILFLLLLSLFITSCLDNQNIKNDYESNSNQNNNPFVKEWHSIKSIIPNNSVLTIKSDGTFHYTYRACLTKGYSEGTWEIHSKYIILNSYITDTCLFISKFGTSCESVEKGEDIKSELQKTVEDYLPVCNDIIYFHFDADSFFIKNDTLFHVQKIDSNYLDSINIFFPDKIKKEFEK
jgi:hypothetical protein